LDGVEGDACPGFGACTGQFTANTMATAVDFLGLGPIGLGSVPATDGDKAAAGEAAGRLALDVIQRDLRPSRLVTREALENAIVGVAGTGGSTNAVLHLLAIASEAGGEPPPHHFDPPSAPPPPPSRPPRPPPRPSPRAAPSSRPPPPASAAPPP